MKNCLSIVAFLAVLVATGWSNTVSFSETYADRIVATREDGIVSYNQIPTGSFSARGKLILNAEEANFTPAADTSLSISVGGFAFEATLGDDPRYVPGKSKSVRFPIEGGSVAVSWAVGRSGAATVTWSVTAKTGNSPAGDEFQASPAAAELGDGENAVIKAADELEIPCQLRFATIPASASLVVTGAVRYSVKTIGRGDEATEYELKSCSIRASGVIQR